MLMLSLLGLPGCAQKGLPLSDYCDYTPVIQKPGDEKIKAPLGVKQRILGNEYKYEERCVK